MLADWIASPENPLTARVMVNRLWQGLFGRGIVASASDFGGMGDLPTHPELLNWLAAEFAAQGWSTKAMLRLVVTSNSYRQSSIAAESSQGQQIDPDNTLLWHMNRQRLDGEIIRDTMLAVSGQLAAQAGGPSIYPELPAGVSERYGWKPSPDVTQRNRRSVYVFVRRNLRYPLFEVFDMPDTNETCGRRNRTTTAPQSLYLLNSELILNQARAFAGRVLRDAGTDQATLIARAYQLAFGREPSSEEIGLAAGFLHRQAELARDRAADAPPLVVPTHMPAGYDPASGAALTDLCHALFNANEFIYVD